MPVPDLKLHLIRRFRLLLAVCPCAFEALLGSIKSRLAFPPRCLASLRSEWALRHFFTATAVAEATPDDRKQRQ